MLLMALGNLWHAEHYNMSQMDASHISLVNVYEIDGFQVQKKYALFIQICPLVVTDLTDKTLIISTFLTFSVYYTVITLKSLDYNVVMTFRFNNNNNNNNVGHLVTCH